MCHFFFLQGQREGGGKIVDLKFQDWLSSFALGEGQEMLTMKRLLPVGKQHCQLDYPIMTLAIYI